MRLVYGVDEGDEAARQVALPVRHAGDVGHDESVVRAHQLNVVGGTRRLADQLVKGEPGAAAADARDVDLAAPDGLHLGVRLGVLGIA